MLDGYNIFIILLAAVANMAIGFLWYSDALFGKKWRVLAGFASVPKEEMMKNAMPAILTSAGLAVVMSFVLGNFVYFSSAETPLMGVELAMWLWAGFVATVLGTTYAYTRKPFVLFLIDSGYHLVAMCVMASILTYLPM